MVVIMVREVFNAGQCCACELGFYKNSKTTSWLFYYPEDYNYDDLIHEHVTLVDIVSNK